MARGSLLGGDVAAWIAKLTTVPAFALLPELMAVLFTFQG